MLSALERSLRKIVTSRCKNYCAFVIFYIFEAVELKSDEPEGSYLFILAINMAKAQCDNKEIKQITSHSSFNKLKQARYYKSLSREH